ncbi:prepilin peptidase-dependent pilin, partial [Klebsiella pneumoniae]
MDKQRGFTLIELMVVIGIIAILSAIGIPAYQNYLRKAALTDLLQTFVPYRTAIELCALDHGGLTPCDGGSNGIPSLLWSSFFGHADQMVGLCTGGQLGGRA